MTLTNVLTQTVDSDFNGLSIKLCDSCLLMSKTFLNENQRPAGTNLWWKTINKISLSFKLADLYDRIPVLFCQVILRYHFQNLGHPELISSDSCQDKMFQNLSTKWPLKSWSIAEQLSQIINNYSPKWRWIVVDIAEPWSGEVNIHYFHRHWGK